MFVEWLTLGIKCYGYALVWAVCFCTAHKHSPPLPPLPPVLLLLLFLSLSSSLSHHERLQPVTCAFVQTHCSHIQTHSQLWTHSKLLKHQTHTRFMHICRYHRYICTHFTHTPRCTFCSDFHSSMCILITRRNSKIIVFAMHIRYFTCSDFICIIFPHFSIPLQRFIVPFKNQQWGPSESSERTWKENIGQTRKTLTMSSVNVDKTKQN